MPKKIGLILSLLLLMSPTCIDAKKTTFPGVFLIDNFENRDLKKWWAFGDMSPNLVQNKPGEFPDIGSFALQLRGATVGGIGTLLNVPGDKYNMIKLAVRGNGPDSGYLAFELFVGDPKTGLIKQNPNNPGYLSMGTKYVYTLKINWNGWRTVIIPTDRFRGEGGHRNEILRLGGKEKWVQLQLIGTPDSNHPLMLGIDTIRLFSK